KRQSSFPRPGPKVKRPRPASYHRRLIQLILHSPVYIERLDKNLLVECGEQNDEVTLLMALVDFFSTFSPQALKGVTMSSTKAFFFDNPCYGLLEEIENEISMWDEGMDLEAEYKGILLRIRKMWCKQRMAVLQSKPLSVLTAEEKQELRRLAI